MYHVHVYIHINTLKLTLLHSHIILAVCDKYCHLCTKINNPIVILTNSFLSVHPSKLWCDYIIFQKNVSLNPWPDNLSRNLPFMVPHFSICWLTVHTWLLGVVQRLWWRWIGHAHLSLKHLLVARVQRVQQFVCLVLEVARKAPICSEVRLYG